MGSHDSVILEADGGSRGNPGPAGFGALLRDAETHEVLAEAAEAISRATNNVAEYRGLIAGLELYLKHTPDALLEVRMDSKLVIEQMAGRWKVKHPAMRPLAISAQRLAPFGTVWTWVPRERNKAADRLANLAMDAAARGEVYDVHASGQTAVPVPGRTRDSAKPGKSRSDDPGPSGSQPDAAARQHASRRRDPTSPMSQPGDSAISRASRPGEATSHASQPGDPKPEAMEPPASGGGQQAAAAGAVIQDSRNPMLGWNERLGEVTTLIFLRHGVTRHTAERRFSGPGGNDPGLTEKGFVQAERAAQALAADGGIDAILASPLQRTRDTAAAVESALGLSLTIEEDFRECAFGAWDGRTLDEVEERWPSELDHWLDSMGYAPPGGGESIIEVQRRVEAALGRTLASYAGRTVVVVSHVNPIKLAVRYCLDIPLVAINKMLLAPASLTTLSFYESGASSLRQFSALP